jgi:hypothetical protein
MQHQLHFIPFHAGPPAGGIALGTADACGNNQNKKDSKRFRE